MDTTITETPKEAARRLSANKITEGYVPEALHEYQAADRTPQYWRIRLKHPDGRKWTPPMRLNGHGFELKEPDFPTGKPIYKLPELGLYAKDAVFIVEGEKCVDALLRLGVIATTSGSSSSADAADWTPLRGRSVIVWPDHDNPGTKYAADVVRHLRALDCNVQLIDKKIVEALPKGGDVADWIAQHVDATGDTIRALPTVEVQAEATRAPTDDDAAPLPAPDTNDVMFYGLTGEVMQAAADGTEVHPAAAGLAFLSFAAVALGRERYVRIGNGYHHPRIYSVHVGRSNAAGKGMALEITERIRKACERDADPIAPVCGHFHDGGLSSREGLAWAIRDASDTKNKEGEPVDPGVDDKRMFVVEEEFANVLQQAKRDGNTLSSALRTAWDGKTLAPLTKTNRTRATRPHIGIHACITPSELACCLESRELTSGFANRFLFAWAERQGVVPFPSATPEGKINGFAKRLRDAVDFAHENGEVTASQGARDRFAAFYRRHRQGLGLPALVRGLIERHPPYAWRLALIFALLDRVDEITEAHMTAALAWLDYCRASVERIFSTATVQADAEEAGELVERIVEVINKAGGTINREPLRVALGKPPADTLDAAIDQADMAGLIGVTSTKKEGGGRPTRAYFTKPAARFGRLARFGSGPSFQQTAETPRLARFADLNPTDSDQTAQTADPLRFAETLVASQTAQTAQTAEGVSGNRAAGTEVIDL